MIGRYLSTLHTRPDHHKRWFSYIVSGSFTLLIFAVWITVRFPSNSTSTVARSSETTPVNDISAEAASPFDSFKASAAQGWKLISTQVSKAKAGLESTDIQGSYTEVRDSALNQSRAVKDLTNNNVE